MRRVLRFLLTTALAVWSLVVLSSTRAFAQTDATPTDWAIRLDVIGEKRIEVITRIRAITALGLQEVNELISRAPVVVKRSLGRSDAELYASQLRAVGAMVSVIPDEPVSAPVPSGPPAVTPAAPGEPAFAVRLEAEGPTRVEVVKRVRELTKLGLKESDDLVKAAPTVVLDALTRASADAVAAYLRDAGATVQVTSAASAPPAPSGSAPPLIPRTPPDPSSRMRQQLEAVPVAYDLVLREAGPNRAAVMNRVRQLRGISLKDAKDFLARLPQPVLQGLNRTDAELRKGELDALLAVTELVAAAPAPAASASATAAPPPAPSSSATAAPDPSTAPPTGPAKRQARAATYRIVLQGYADKTAVMTALRQLTGLGVKEVKALVESAPVVVRSGLNKTDADLQAQKLRDARATVAIEVDR